MNARNFLNSAPAKPSRRDLLRLGVAVVFAPVWWRSRIAATSPLSGGRWLLGPEDF